MVLFHKIFNRLIPEELPSYLALFSGHTRLRSSHLDRLCFMPSILSRGSSNYLLKKSFFYRSHLLWNSLPLDIKEILCPSKFKLKVKQFLWNMEIEEVQLDDDFDHTSSDCIT